MLLMIIKQLPFVQFSLVSTHGRTVGRTVGRTDKASYRGVWDTPNQSPKGIIWSAIPLPCFSNRYKVILLGYPFGGRAAAPIGDEVL